MNALSFPDTLCALLDFLDEQVTVHTGHIHRDGEATIATTLIGTLVIGGDAAIDEVDLDPAEAPIVLGFAEHGCSTTIHPNVFVSACRAADVLTVEMVGVTVELARG